MRLKEIQFCIPRNDVACGMWMTHDIHLAWQGQYLVSLETAPLIWRGACFFVIVKNVIVMKKILDAMFCDLGR